MSAKYVTPAVLTGKEAEPSPIRTKIPTGVGETVGLADGLGERVADKLVLGVTLLVGLSLIDGVILIVAVGLTAGVTLMVGVTVLVGDKLIVDVGLTTGVVLVLVVDEKLVLGVELTAGVTLIVGVTLILGVALTAGVALTLGVLVPVEERLILGVTLLVVNDGVVDGDSVKFAGLPGIETPRLHFPSKAQKRTKLQLLAKLMKPLVRKTTAPAPSITPTDVEIFEHRDMPFQQFLTLAQRCLGGLGSV